MLGIVFCGGKSSRMGTDKGLIPFMNKNWAGFAAEKLSALNIPVRISINLQQKDSYKQFFAEDIFLLDDEALGIGGPLLGLLSAHLLQPTEDLFILACDLPLMKDSILRRLYAAEQENPDYEAFVFIQDGAAEPLCAIYKSKGLKKVMDEFNTNGVLKYSMKSVLSFLKVFELAVSGEEREAFRNFNTHGLT
jgi:molybdopterin-guanine dinucleotide biosynthesis protein A